MPFLVRGFFIYKLLIILHFKEIIMSGRRRMMAKKELAEAEAAKAAEEAKKKAAAEKQRKAAAAKKKKAEAARKKKAQESKASE